MKPTNDDLARLIPEAVSKANGDEHALSAHVLVQQAATLLRMISEQWDKSEQWATIRGWALRAFYLCAMIVWEAGRRMVPLEPDEQWVVRWDGCWLRQTADWSQSSATTLADAGKWPTESAARERLVLANREWQKNAKIERLTERSTAAKAPEARMFVNDGNGGMRPLDGPADDPVPAAKSVDVEALLSELDRRTASTYYPRNGEPGFQPNTGYWSDKCLAWHLAAALRAERERAKLLQQEADYLTERSLAKGQSLNQARGHLRAVLDFMWPGSGGPTVAQKARAFLAGDGQAPQEDLERVLDDAEMMHDSHRRKHMAAVDRIRDLSREAEDWRAKWVTERESHNRTRAQLATKDESRWHGTVRVPEDLVGKIQGELMAEQAAHRTTKSALDDARAAIAAEDEAHAHTRARLADVERYVDENVEARKQAVIRCVQAQTELAVLERGAQDALAAQNRAESEAASLRVEVTDLQRKVAEGEALVDRLVSWAKKGRA